MYKKLAALTAMPLQTPDKAAIVRALQERVRADLAALTESQERASEGVTHEESRQENDKDARAIEASYLARGLARRVVELRALEDAFSHPCYGRPFVGDEPVQVGALVTLEDRDGLVSWCLVAAQGGGLQAALDGVTVRVVTPESPLGGVLLGKRVDDDVQLHSPKGLRELTVLGVR